VLSNTTRGRRRLASRRRSAMLTTPVRSKSPASQFPGWLKFAAKLEKDHTAANDELKEVASKKNITLPASPSKNHQALHDKLAKLSGAEFDKAYVSAMLEDHQKDVREFARVSSASGDADVKAFATKTLPTLKDHLKQVQDLSKSIGAKKPTS